MHNDEQTPPINWDLHREGRAWTGDEVRERIAQLMELKFEISEGKLFWDDENPAARPGNAARERRHDTAVRLGDLARWKEAVAAAEKDRRPKR